MKSFILLCALAAINLIAAAQSSPAVKVQQARSAQELSALSQNDMAALEFRAEKLCWFESFKGETPAAWYTLTDRNGNTVALTDAMVADFNPLLFNLPQQTVRCENLPVQTTTGNQYLLIVRSEEQMQKQWQRRVTKNSKNQTK
jgi:hypothetical protein